MKSKESDDFSSTTSLPISRDSDEWGTVEAFLQLVFRSSNVSLRSLWSVSNPVILARFERRAQNLSGVVPTLIASEDLDSSVTLSSVCEKGFPDAPAGLRVQVGNMSLPGGFFDPDSQGERKVGRGRRMFEFFLVKVITGKSLVGDAAVLRPDGTETGGIRDLPVDYDSLLLRNPSSNSALTVGGKYLPPHTFTQTYIVRHPNTQVLPLFVCRFEVDTDKEEQVALAPCQNCDKAAATIWCAADSAALCPECDEAHHSVNKLTLRHIRVPINERPRPNGPCAVRSHEPAQLWSEPMGIAVSLPTQAEHFPTSKFQDIKEAYTSSIRLARREDPLFASMKENMLSQIKAQDEAISSIERMFTECEETCYRKIGDSLQKTVDMSQKRTNLLLEAERELGTRIQFIQWVDQVLQPYQHVLPPTEWLQLWLKQYRLVKYHFANKPDVDISNIPPEEDIRISGHLKIVNL